MFSAHCESIKLAYGARDGMTAREEEAKALFLMAVPKRLLARAEKLAR